MNLRSPREDELALVATWLAEPRASRWLRFGPGVSAPSAPLLRGMLRRDTHVLRVFSATDGGPPVGLVALSDVDRGFGTGVLWYALGDAGLGGKGLTSRAVSRLLTEAFASGLGSIFAWVVEGNVASTRVLGRNGFRFVGRQRACHVVDGSPRDRLLFDLLAGEHTEVT